MITDILGNELKENDVVCTKVTEQVVGRIVHISEGGKIGQVTQAGVILDVPTEILMLVEVRRQLKPGTSIVDVIKVHIDKNKPSVN